MYDPVGQAVAGTQAYSANAAQRRHAMLIGILEGGLAGLAGGWLAGRLLGTTPPPAEQPLQPTTPARCALCGDFIHSEPYCHRAMRNPNVRPTA